MTGIYKITDQKGRIYIGSSVDVEKRFKQHKKSLLSATHVNKNLRDYYKKYGESAYIYEIVEECSVDDLLLREQYYIDTFSPFYNINLSAAKPPSWSGKKHKAETISKIKEWNIGRKHTEETLAKFKIIRATEESKQQMRINASKAKSNGWLGKKYSEENLRKISEGNKGKIVSEETREKLRVKHTGKRMSQESREKMRKSQTGRKHTPESIEKMRQVAIERHNRKRLMK